MTVTDGAYIAVLEKKLVQSERSLYEFRQIFNHFSKGLDERRLQESTGGQAASTTSKVRDIEGEQYISMSEDCTD